LLSLLKAREFMLDGFVSTDADIVYDGAIVEKLVRATDAIALGCDTAWRRRYIGRSQHPETDAEKLRAAKELFFDRQYAQAREAWQSVRASQASFVVAAAQGAGQGSRIHAKNGSLALAQRTNAWPPLPVQLGQTSARQSVRVLHDASSSTEHGAGQAISAHIGPGSRTGS